MILSEEIEQVDFGDTRIDNRCKDMLKRMHADPDKSFPRLADNWGILKAFYRFMNNPKVTREKLLSSHICETVKRCATHETVLVIQDTTTLSYPHHPKAKGLGYVGTREKGLGYGMLVHNTCAIACGTHEPLGMLHQEVIVRQKLHPQEETYKDRLGRNRESDKWLNGVQKTKELLSGHPHIIHVADREADIYFLMRDILRLEQGFVIRQAKNRNADDGRLSTTIDNAKETGTMSVFLQKNGTRKARTAKVSLRANTVIIHPPNIVNRIGDSFSVNLVVVQEMHPPKNIPPLYWVLLTTEPVDTYNACVQVVEHYQGRWTIEEFHKALKTGCGIEERQLTTRQGLENVLGLSTIIAVLLLHVRFMARVNEKQEEGTLTTTQRIILSQKFHALTEHMSNQQAFFHIARLGGFLARKHDGNPGWITLLRGYQKLLLLEQGYLLALALVGKR